MDNPFVSIIIRTLNEGRYLDDVLKTIHDQRYPVTLLEVLIVDSGSTDDTLAIAERHGCKILNILREDFSFGRSLNLGCDAARGEILVFISGHCVPVDGNWLSSLVAPFRDSYLAITYGRQMGGPETKFSEQALFEKYFPAESDGGHQAPFFCNNANAALRKSVWAAIRFDESLTGLEDMHLAKRSISQGGKVSYIPTACVYHYHHEKWRQVKRRYEREAIALQAIMPEVHFVTLDAIRYFVAGVLGDWGKALKQRILLKHACPIIAFRFCQYYGAWRGNHIHRKLSKHQKERYFYPN